MANSTIENSVIDASELVERLRDRAGLVVLAVYDPRGDEPEDPPVDRIPGAHHVAFTELVGEPFPDSGGTPLPSADQVTALIARTGIHEDSTVVVYGAGRPAITTRIWWVLRWAGLADVRYLDGGSDAWREAGGETVQEIPEPVAGTAVPRLGGLPAIGATGSAQWADDGHLIDARPPQAYRGDPDHPRSGHVPGAVSVPSGQNLDDGRLKSPEELRELYGPYLDGRPIAVYCGGGVAATVEVVALARLGIEAALYPGSWSAWSSDPERPVARGTEPR